MLLRQSVSWADLAKSESVVMQFLYKGDLLKDADSDSVFRQSVFDTLQNGQVSHF